MNHYKYLEKYFMPFLCKLLNVESTNGWNTGIITAHGDKGYSYQWAWENANIPFNHGMMLFLLSYIHPWSKESRDTKNGWVDVKKWVINNYKKFKPIIEEIEKEVK